MSTCTQDGCRHIAADHCPTCGRHILDFADNSLEHDDGQRWCMTHAVAAGVVWCVENPDNVPGQCAGAVEYRFALSGTGVSFLRCDKHWGERLDREEETRRRYGHPDSVIPPSDFDPTYAGESWDEEY